MFATLKISNLFLRSPWRPISPSLNRRNAADMILAHKLQVKRPFKEAGMSETQDPVMPRHSAQEQSEHRISAPSRRSFLVGLAATGAIAAFSKRTAALQNG